MNWQNFAFNLSDAAFSAKQDRSTLHGLASLCRRARHARHGHGSQNQTPPHAPLDDGQGGSDSNPAC